MSDQDPNQDPNNQDRNNAGGGEGGGEGGQGGGDDRGFKLEDLPKEAQEAIKERDRLKAHHETLLNETKQERERRQELERQHQEAEQKRAEENGEYQKLYQKTHEQLEQERENIRKFQEQISQRDIANDSLRLASQVGVDDGSVELLSEKIQQFASWKDGEVKYAIDGVEATREQVTDYVSQKFPRLVKGSGSTGGGATGSQGGAQTTGKVDGDKSERAAHFRQKFGLQN